MDERFYILPLQSDCFVADSFGELKPFIISDVKYNDVIDWFEKDIVRITDQSLGNYILFLVIYEKKWIDLCDLIDHCIPKWTKLIVNLLDMLLNQFLQIDI